METEPIETSAEVVYGCEKMDVEEIKEVLNVSKTH